MSLPVLTLAVKEKYFRLIKSGDKHDEYREVNDYWQVRLEGKQFSKIVITLGYSRSDDTSRRLEFEWSGYTVKTIRHEFFHNKKPTLVYAIHLYDSSF